MSLRRFVDFHTHSNASDGTLSPSELVRLADQAKLLAIALTDHDTVAGLAEAREAAKQFPHLRLISGIEISAQCPTGTLHILGLELCEDSAALASLTARMQAARENRNPKILQKLRDLGMEVTLEEVCAAAGKSSDTPGRIVGRLHIAHTLCRKGYVKSTDEAFEKFLGSGRKAYVDKERLSSAQAITAIHDAGGLAVLAHPVQLGYENSAQLQRMVHDYVDAGLDGIEAYHTDHTNEQTRLYMDLARRFRLGVTGGSDYHGDSNPQAALGHPRVPAIVLGDKFARRLLGVE